MNVYSSTVQHLVQAATLHVLLDERHARRREAGAEQAHDAAVVDSPQDLHPGVAGISKVN